MSGSADAGVQQLDVEKIVPEPKPSGEARRKGKKALQQETEFVSRRAKKLKDDIAALEYDSKKHDLDARRRYGPLLFLLVVAWLFLVLATVWASAAKITAPSWWPDWLPLASKFDLSDAVLIALVSGATINVIGLLFAVVNYTFPKRKDD